MLKPSVDDLLRSSVRSILKNKGRTILTSLGIIIGVTSVILLTSIGNGLKSYINKMFEDLGTNLVYVSPGQVFNENGGFNNNEASLMMQLTFDKKDQRDLRRELNTTVLALRQSALEVKSAFETKKNSTVIGTSPEYGVLVNSEPEDGDGRWFTAEENDKGSSVAILGPEIADTLFPNGNALGKKIIIGSRNFRVIGLAPKKGASFGGPGFDEMIFIPLETSFSMEGEEKIQQFIIQSPDRDSITSVKRQAENVMADRYDEDSFSVYDSSQLLNSINSIIGTLTVGLTGIAAISLIVGGIGIMNIMLVTVSERTREIGLRKAIGAYPRAILLQFLFEAVILSLVGGVTGILLGSLGTLAISNFFPAKVTLSSVAIAFGVSTIVGVIFGVAPARKASKLSPIEALRYE